MTITTPAEYDAAMAEVESMFCRELTTSEDARFRELIGAIVAYEEKTWPIDAPTGPYTE
jgi:antitoxin component HigA of HigAB toxin-antitoxin module